MRRFSVLLVVGSLGFVALFTPRIGAKNPSPTSTPLIATFADNNLTPDRIQSDGLGPYVNGQSNVKAILDGRGDFDLDTNTTPGPAIRTLFLDFTSCASGPGTCTPPFTTDRVDSYMSTSAGGLPSMAVGSSKASSLQVSFVGGYFLRFDPSAYPETSNITVTRTSLTTWTVQAPATGIAKLVTYTGNGKNSTLIDHGDYLMPFGVNLQVKQ